MKKILITGGCGYVGSAICHLLNNQYEITVIDNLTNGNTSLLPKNIQFIKSNIKNIKYLKKKLKHKFDLVIHCAAYVDARESDLKPNKYLKNNFHYAKKFFDFCINLGVKNFILSSTCAVYSKTKFKVSEKSKIRPMSTYGLSKLKIENYLINLSIKNKINYVILRYFNVAGADPKLKYGIISKKNKSLIKTCCKNFLKNKNITIYGKNFPTLDGTTIRDYIHIKDLAIIHKKIFLKMRKNIKNIILNCGYGNGYSTMEIANYFVKKSKYKIKISFNKKKKSDLPKSVADNKKIIKILNWKPKYTNINTILRHSLNWEKKLEK